MAMILSILAEFNHVLTSTVLARCNMTIRFPKSGKQADLPTYLCLIWSKKRVVYFPTFLRCDQQLFRELLWLNNVSWLTECLINPTFVLINGWCHVCIHRCINSRPRLSRIRRHLYVYIRWCTSTPRTVDVKLFCSYLLSYHNCAVISVQS